MAIKAIKGRERIIFFSLFCQGLLFPRWYGWHAIPVVQFLQWTSAEFCNNLLLQPGRSLKHWTGFNECCPLERPKSSTNGFDNLSVLVGVWLNAHSFLKITKRCMLFLIMNSLPIFRRFTQKNTFASLAKLQKCQLQLRLYLPPNTSQNEARKIHLQSFEKSTSIFPGWVELVQSCWKLRHSILMVTVMLFAILRRFSMVMWIPQKVAMAIHWEFCEVSCEFHFFPHRKLWGSQSIYINLLSSVFGRYPLSWFIRLLSKTSSIWDCMILSDIREALHWTLNWNSGFWGDNVPIQQNGNQFVAPNR